MSYKYLAMHYLSGLTEDEFMRCEWGEIKSVVDACNYRTAYSLPYVSTAIYNFCYGVSKGADLTNEEMEMLKMYRLWKQWNTPPWEVNGGKIYPEDIETVMRIDDHVNSASKHQMKKEEWKKQHETRGSGIK